MTDDYDEKTTAIYLMKLVERRVIVKIKHNIKRILK